MWLPWLGGRDRAQRIGAAPAAIAAFIIGRDWWAEIRFRSVRFDPLRPSDGEGRLERRLLQPFPRQMELFKNND